MTFSPNRSLPVNPAHFGPIGALGVELRQTERSTWIWTVKDATFGTGEEFLDLFNAAGSGIVLRLLSVLAIPSADVVATVTIMPRIHLVRTSAVGTGGTLWTEGQATPDATAGGSLGKADPRDTTALPAEVTGRGLPTGGATNEWWISTRWLGADDDGAPLTPEVELLPRTRLGALLVLPEGYGIKVLQGSVAGAGKVGFQVVFTIEPG